MQRRSGIETSRIGTNKWSDDLQTGASGINGQYSTHAAMGKPLGSQRIANRKSEISKSNKSCIANPEIPKFLIALRRGSAIRYFGVSGFAMQDSFDFDFRFRFPREPLEKDKSQRDEDRYEDHTGVKHVAYKRRHLDSRAFGDALHH